MISINTDYSKITCSTEHTKNILKTISNHGFKCIHWVHQWNGTDYYSIPEMEQIKTWLKEFDLKVTGVHASDGTISGKFDDRKMFVSPNEYNRRAGVELVKNRIDFASFIDAGEIVLHVKMFHLLNSDLDYSSFANTYWKQLFKSLDAIIAYGKKQNINIAIENLEYPNSSLQLEQFDRIFNRYNPDDLKFCFDLGHGMISDFNNPFAFLKKYSERLINLHLNCGKENTSNTTDYKKILKNLDVHNIPNEKTIDINRLSQLISNSPDEIPITFEIAVSEAEISNALTETLRIGKKIEQLVKKYRNENN